MFDGQASRTAERVAVERAAHQILDAPALLVDPLAMRVIDSQHAASLRQHPERHDRSPIAKPTRAVVVVRSRIAEDEVAKAVAEGITQYVILGAGLDTFGYRSPHPALRVFEVDYPATQQLKRQRLADAGINVPDRLTFVPCDFARDPLWDTLRAAGFDRARPAVVAWLGVAMYLEPDDVMETLRAVGTLPAGTVLVFDYAVSPDSLAWIPRMFYHGALRRLAAIGEPWRSFLEPQSLRADLVRFGFRDVSDLAPADVNGRYFADRADGLKVGSVGRIVIARR